MALSQTIVAEGLSTDEEKFSYAIGVQVGNSLKQGGAELDVNALTMAIQDVLNEKEFQVSPAEMQEVMSRFREKEFEQRLESGQENRQEEKEFLAANKSKKGVVETASGLQYKILKEGTGKKPTVSDTVEVHYEGRLLDGTVFDSSYQRGESITFPLANVIKGWQEAVPLMTEGSKYQIYVPAELAYGERGAGASIGPNTMLIFDIELISVK